MEDWLNAHKHWLQEHQTSAWEVGEQLAKIDRDIQAAENECLEDWKLIKALNAILGCAETALRVKGYRLRHSSSHHAQIIQTLEFTLGVELRLITKLDGFRKKRNVTEYDRAGSVSAQEAEEALKFAKFLKNELEQWLKEKYPHLVRSREPPLTGLF